MPETIEDRIRAWARSQIQNSGVMTRNTDCYNHMLAAVDLLVKEDWAGWPSSSPLDDLAPPKG